MSDKEDNIDDYEEEEDEDDYDEPQRKKQKLSSAVEEFIDAEAEVDEEAEDEDEEGDEDNDFISNDNEASDPSIRRQIQLQQQSYLAPSTTKSRKRFNFDDFEKRVLQNDGDDQEMAEQDDEPVRSKTTVQAKNIPTNSDPRLFLVRCKTGKENEAVMYIMQRYMLYEKNPKYQPLEIKSAVCLDGHKGYIYIEAYKEAHVKTAIRGIPIIYESKVKQVPLKEMTLVFSAAKRNIELKRDQYVRIKRGLYDADLGQIFDVDESRQLATVKLIPRLDIKTDEDDDDSIQPDTGKKRKRGKPLPRLFNKEEVEAAGESVQSKSISQYGMKFDIYQGKKFHDGFLYKAIPFKSLETKGVMPTLEELKKFNPTGDASSFAGYKRKAQFVKGDKVQVASGDLKGIVGVIIDVDADNDTVTIQPKHEKINQPLKFPSYELQKFFDVGTFCQVISGKYESETGHVVKVSDDSVVLYNDVKKIEMTVFTSDIRLASETAATETSVGNYSLHDMIRIDAQTSGVIVKIDKEVFKVLDNNGFVKTIRPQEMGPKRTNRPGFKIEDRNKNPVGINDPIQVADGPHKGRQGSVRHIFKIFLFCHAKDMIDNSGIFVVRAKQVELRGGAHHAATIQNKPNSMSAPKHVPMMSFRKQNDPLINKTVRIKRGTYKGYIGMVRNSSEDTVRVELHSIMKTIAVSRHDVTEIIDNQPQSTPHYSMAPRTPAAWDAPKTPGGYETPLRSDYPETPRSASQHAAIWDKNQPNTPRREPPKPAVTTPSISKATPTNNKPTFTPFTPAAQPTPMQRKDTTQMPIHTPFYTTPAQGLGSAQTPSVNTPRISTPMEQGVATPLTPGMNLHPTTPMNPLAQPTTPQAFTPHVPHTPHIPQNTTTTPFNPSIFTPHLNPHTPRTVVHTNLYHPVETPMSGTPMMGSHHAPVTPHVSAHVEENWVEPGLEVSFPSKDQGPITGFVKRVAGVKCTVESNKKEYDVYVDDLQPTMPSQYDHVKIIRGENAGVKGKLINIDESEGIVHFMRENIGEVAVVDLKNMTKCLQQS